MILNPPAIPSLLPSPFPRARMPKPRSTLVRLVLPSTRYSLGLEPDYRINFALNCGSLSLPPTVPIFTQVHTSRGAGIEYFGKCQSRGLAFYCIISSCCQRLLRNWESRVTCPAWRQRT